MSNSSSFLTLMVTWCPARNVSEEFEWLTEKLDCFWASHQYHEYALSKCLFLCLELTHPEIFQKNKMFVTERNTHLPINEDKLGKTCLLVLDFEECILDFTWVKVFCELIQPSISYTESKLLCLKAKLQSSLFLSYHTCTHKLEHIALPLIPEHCPVCLILLTRLRNIIIIIITITHHYHHHSPLRCTPP